MRPLQATRTRPVARSIILINKWDAVTVHRTDGKPAAKLAVFEEQVREHLKFLSYAP